MAPCGSASSQTGAAGREHHCTAGAIDGFRNMTPSETSQRDSCCCRLSVRSRVTKRTRVIWNSRCPKWNEEFRFLIHFPGECSLNCYCCSIAAQLRLLAAERCLTAACHLLHRGFPVESAQDSKHLQWNWDDTLEKRFECSCIAVLCREPGAADRAEGPRSGAGRYRDRPVRFSTIVFDFEKRLPPNICSCHSRSPFGGR